MLPRLLLVLPFTVIADGAAAQSKLPKCTGGDFSTWNNCFGELARPSGLKFAAEFRNGKPNGQGTVLFPNGDKYVGELKDGTNHGKGTFTWSTPDGVLKYAGEWRDGQRHGRGTLYRPDGSVALTGTWQNDDFVRP